MSVSHMMYLDAVALGTFCKTCKETEFQPVATYSYEFLRPACQMKRTVCEDFDAVTITTGNASVDDVCTCNLLKGYRPVNGDNNCRSFNASSGCRCVHQSCPEGQALHPTGRLTRLQ